MILTRLKDYIDAKGISISLFERSIGMSNASFGKSLKSGGAIGTDKLENILNVYPDINIQWLLTGKGSMLLGDEGEPSFINVNKCDKCQLKDELIASLREQVHDKQKLIEYLEEENSTARHVQKRKASAWG